LVVVLLLSGCGDSYEPVKREIPAVPETAEIEAPAEPGGQVIEEDLGGELTCGSIRLTAPEQWIRKPPRSQFVQAEFTLPKAEGDERDGRLTLSIAGGSIEDNIKRWRDQFGGKPEKDSEEERDIVGLKVTVVDFSGTFNDQVGPFTPGVQREGYRMLAAIVPIGDTLHFIKAYGPEKTMADNVEAFDSFLQTIQKQ
jgi:hypothetical protein